MTKAIAIPTTGDHGIVDSQGICIEQNDVARGFITKRPKIRVLNKECEPCNNPGLPGLALPHVLEPNETPSVPIVDLP